MPAPDPGHALSLLVAPEGGWDAAAASAPKPVTKIVLGDLDGEKTGADLPPGLAVRFQELTHLYLWNLTGIDALPPLPPGLKCLDIRGCPDLASLPPLPPGLTDLVIRDCPSLAEIPPTTPLASLRHLALEIPDPTPETPTPSPGLSGDWIKALIAGAENLETIRIGGAPLESVNRWPSALRDLRLSRCRALDRLPQNWPGTLTRLELRETPVPLSPFPTPPEGLDHVDLTGASGITTLPAKWREDEKTTWPRTLVLHRSGVRKPPAPEHGTLDENVAGKTRRFFKDVRLTGTGEVRRAKLLVLGNGSAGKTFLSLALVPGHDPRKATSLGTTHGIQFWDWEKEGDHEPFRTTVSGDEKDIHLHIWDFGGQEIYHNAHSLFMGTGSLFALVWNPSQDGEKPLPCDSTGYCDRWRPLRYWIDFIRHARKDARIAIICSQLPENTPPEEIRSRLAEQLKGIADPPECFVIPKLPPEYESKDAATQEELLCWLQGLDGYADLGSWLRREVGALVTEEGTAVLSYWAIAQNMVEDWFRRTPGGKGLVTEYKTMPPNLFSQLLGERISAEVDALAPGTEKLRDALADGFELAAEDRIPRTLGFLTHSGWIYWDPALFGEQAIIGQQWALDAIYTIMDRRPESTIYRKLIAAKGRFTLRDLGDWTADLGEKAWRTHYGEDEQKILLSFMEKMGVCFQLIRGEDAWHREPVYISPEHLPCLPTDPATAGELILPVDLKADFAIRAVGLDPIVDSVENPAFHRGHWSAILAGLGKHFGTDAEYARSGFLVTNREGQHILVLAHFAENRLGGKVEVTVSGEAAGKRCAAMLDFVNSHLPGEKTAKDTPTEDPSPKDEAHLRSGHHAGSRPKILRVFVSYAWDQDGTSDYGAIVDEIAAALDPFVAARRLTYFHDRENLSAGDHIKTKISNAIREAHKIIVVHSDNYWKSFSCMWEFDEFFEDKNPRQDLICIAHPTSNIGRDADSYITWWEDRNNVPEQWRDLPFDDQKLGYLKTLFGVANPDRFRKAAKKNIGERWDRIGGSIDPYRIWEEDNHGEVIGWILEKLGLDPANGAG